MDWVAAAVALLLCASMAAAEAALTRRDLPAWLSSLKLPRLYASLWVWVLVAFATYVMQGVIAFRLLVHGETPYAAAALLALVAVMAANVAYTAILDRTRSPRWAYRGVLWFVPVLAVLQIMLALADPVSAWLNLAYVGWVVAYDLPIMHALWRLNR